LVFGAGFLGLPLILRPMIYRPSKASPNETRITASVPKPRLVRLELGDGPVGGWLTVRDRPAVRIPAIGFDPVTMMLKDPIGEVGPAAILNTELNGGRPPDGVRLTANPSGSPRTDSPTGPAIPRDRLAKIITDTFAPTTRVALAWLRETE